VRETSERDDSERREREARERGERERREREARERGERERREKREVRGSCMVLWSGFFALLS
jgi:hypothetical protein